MHCQWREKTNHKLGYFFARWDVVSSDPVDSTSIKRLKGVDGWILDITLWAKLEYKSGNFYSLNRNQSNESSWSNHVCNLNYGLWHPKNMISH